MSDYESEHSEEYNTSDYSSIDSDETDVDVFRGNKKFMKKILENESDECLYNRIKTKFDELVIKDCIDWTDPHYTYAISRSLTHGRNMVEKGYDGYKVLLKGNIYQKLEGNAIALYIPKHIYALYINNRFKIYLNEEHYYKNNEHYYKNDEYDDIEDLLEQSKKLPTEGDFSSKYKKIVLITPFIPENTIISFDTEDDFYYETLIKRVYHSYTDMNRNHVYVDSCISSYNVFSSPSGNSAYWVNYINDYMKIKQNFDYDQILRLEPDESKYEKFNEGMYSNIIYRMPSNEFTTYNARVLMLFQSM